MSRPTHADIADHYRLEWLCERDDAETVPCPPAPYGCGQPAGKHCVNPITGRELNAPAHGARIRAARLARQVPSPRRAA